MSKQWFLLWTALLLVTGSVAATAAEKSVEPERCIQLSRVKSTEILDNQRILFELQSGQYFLNSLPYACPGLRKSSTILYRTSLDQLCNVDVITVLEPGGGGFWPGASCGLGKFEPLQKDEMEQLRESVRKSR